MSDDSPVPAVPERDARAAIRTVAEAGISAVPWVGGPAQLLLTDFLPSAFLKRRDAWFVLLGDVVNELVDRVDGLEAADLADNPKFVSSVAEASRIAAGTHLEAKFELLKRALQHVVLDPDRDDFLTSRFLRFIEDLSPEHFMVMNYIADPESAIATGQIEAPTIVSQGELGATTKGDLGLGTLVFQVVLRDLHDRELLKVDIESTEFSEPYWSAVTTPLGTELANFVRAF